MEKPILLIRCVDSGTLPIEAAMIAQNIPAGKFRKDYAFANWKIIMLNYLIM